MEKLNIDINNMNTHSILQPCLSSLSNSTAISLSCSQLMKTVSLRYCWSSTVLFTLYSFTPTSIQNTGSQESLVKRMMKKVERKSNKLIKLTKNGTYEGLTTGTYYKYFYITHSTIFSVYYFGVFSALHGSFIISYYSIMLFRVQLLCRKRTCLFCATNPHLPFPRLDCMENLINFLK